MELKNVTKKKLSQVYVEHVNGQENEIVDIVLPLEQVVLKDGEKEEENLSSLMSWKIVK